MTSSKVFSSYFDLEIIGAELYLVFFCLYLRRNDFESSFLEPGDPEVSSSQVFTGCLDIEMTSCRVVSSCLDLEVTPGQVFLSVLDLEVISNRVFYSCLDLEVTSS